ncbi:LysR substrate-binding domain-containing protein [Pararobbsia silviterrae]|uniref:LysR family transcriptional regulator n=1 Tax=Pararobbsia silviterrae TaxID=1792498 RepID=A0A494XX15_9BURK|nr:LysR substrate-binding domain-containing protein [Pararobbsia silviterrae]RKP53548.1 LysR family transcriptional regulator [Pararobbsia silviterrae]
MNASFDIAVLRSFVAGMDLGSFAKAADRVGRSTSAVSAQIRKLEEQTGKPIFRKSGRGLALTEAGQTLLQYARRLVELNDEALAATRGVDLEGWVRLGLQEDFGESVLPGVLGQFSRAHPKVRIEARVARNVDLFARLDAGELDLALVWDDRDVPAQLRYTLGTSEIVAEPAMRWIGTDVLQWDAASGEPLPLILFDGSCMLSSMATAALDRAGIAWRVVFTSPSLAGLWAAAGAGLGVTVRTHYGLPSTVRILDAAAHGLPPLPSLPLALVRASNTPTPPVDQLAALVLDAVRLSRTSGRSSWLERLSLLL